MECSYSSEILWSLLKISLEILQTSQGPSVSLLKPVMSSIIKGILDITNTDGEYTQTIKYFILESFVDGIKDYDFVNDLLLLASIIDARFKIWAIWKNMKRKKLKTCLNQLLLNTKISLTIKWGKREKNYWISKEWNRINSVFPKKFYF